jgi:hypothetical protein
LFVWLYLVFNTSEDFGTQNMRKTITAICTVLILLASGKVAQACSCTVHPVCDPHRYLDADFIGEVISSENVKHQLFDDWPGVLFQVRVLENFRGNQKVGEFVKVFTGQGGGDCGYRFKIGSKYLIDAAEKDGGFETGHCTRTAPIEESQVELRLLRTIAAGKKVPDLTGILSQNIGLTPETSENKPFSNIRVSLQPVAGGQAFESTTDIFGSFTFPILPSGRYRIHLELPSDFSPAWSNYSGFLRDDRLPLLIIKKSNEEFAACHIEILTETSGSISGIIQVPGYKSNHWTVEANSVDTHNEPEDTVGEAYPDAKGFFRLSHLPAGRYAVQIVKRGTFIESAPQIVDLKDGEKKTGLILKIQ